MKKQERSKIVLCFILAGFFVSCVIVKNDSSNSVKTSASEGNDLSLGTNNTKKDLKQYVDSIWEPVIVPRIESLSVDYTKLMAGLKADEDGTCQKYGFRQMQEGNPYNFAVKGTVKFLSIDTSSMSGTVALDFAPFDGKAECTMSIGPIFRGTSVRDIQNTLSINDFENQVEFARFGRELNNKVKDAVLGDIDFSKYTGAEAELLGVFTYSGKDNPVEIVPVRLSISGK